jgi:hypothetical protein
MRHVRDQNGFAVILECLAAQVRTLIRIQREERTDNKARALAMVSIQPRLFGRESLRPEPADHRRAVPSSQPAPEVLRVVRVASEASADGDWNKLSGEGDRWQAVSDIPAMLENQQFHDEFAGHASRRFSHGPGYQERITSLIAIDELPGSCAGPVPVFELEE